MLYISKYELAKQTSVWPIKETNEVHLNQLVFYGIPVLLFMVDISGGIILNLIYFAYLYEWYHDMLYEKCNVMDYVHRSASGGGEGLGFGVLVLVVVGENVKSNLDIFLRLSTLRTSDAIQLSSRNQHKISRQGM